MAFCVYSRSSYAYPYSVDFISIFILIYIVRNIHSVFLLLRKKSCKKAVKQKLKKIIQANNSKCSLLTSRLISDTGHCFFDSKMTEHTVGKQNWKNQTFHANFVGIISGIQMAQRK